MTDIGEGDGELLLEQVVVNSDATGAFEYSSGAFSRTWGLPLIQKSLKFPMFPLVLFVWPCLLFGACRDKKK